MILNTVSPGILRGRGKTAEINILKLNTCI